MVYRNIGTEIAIYSLIVPKCKGGIGTAASFCKFSYVKWHLMITVTKV